MLLKGIVGRIRSDEIQDNGNYCLITYEFAIEHFNSESVDDIVHTEAR